jgi:dihydroxyacetone kinase
MRAKPKEVSVVIGGGSGHYPAFGGLVGKGLAHGAAMGNVFASPSAQQIYNVAKSASNGGGILFSYGNYAGDVLNFNQAQERLISEGFEVETVVVTDDIASASKDEIEKRRGIAGDLIVFKAACWAAEQGKTLAEVKKFTAFANSRTRTIGVAFSGCTLPGAKAPLFSVEDGLMEVGMGIHGEPGLYKLPRPNADELAKILVDQILGDLPEGIDPRGSKAALILSGLGSVKYEELFVLYRKVFEILDQAGVEVIEPEVGELVTSFDMAGVSLTLCWLDSQLEQSWKAPASAPAFRKGTIQGSDNDEVSIFDPTQTSQIFVKGTEVSVAGSQKILAAFSEIKKVIDASFEELGRIDAIAGDGDHGIGMQRGVLAAHEALSNAVENKAGAASALNAAADAWSDVAGGTSGVIWGVILSSIASELDNEGEITIEQISLGVAKALQNVQNFGKAQVGDKTLIDTLDPFSRSISSSVASGKSFSDSWASAALVAEQAAESTKDLLPKIGRARPHAEKSLGTPDPGALSLALIIRAVERSWD